MEGDGAASLLELQASFVDLNLEFRHYPDSRCSELKWQAGKSKLIEIEHNGHWNSNQSSIYLNGHAPRTNS
jgi:hypothetical protein